MIGMQIHNLTYPCALMVTLASGVAVCAEPAIPLLEPIVPAISETHKTFLSRLARRTVREVVAGHTPYEPGYIPAALKNEQAEMIVRLRQGGYLVAAVAVGPGSIALATRDAAQGAAHMLVDGGEDDVDVHLVDRLLIEIEAVGAPQAIEVAGDWRKPRVIDPYVTPGVHGLVLLGERGRHRFCPTELFTNTLVLADALKRWTEATDTKGSEIADVRLMRFRTVHWYQADQSARIVSLFRGLTLVPPESVSRAGLSSAIDRLSQYMVYRQLETGLFTYEYEPGADQYSETNSIVRQVGAVTALSAHAKWSGSAASLAATDLAIRYHLQGLTRIRGVNNAAFIATADHSNKLGVTALLCLAMALHPEADRHADVREKLAGGMLRLQQPSGMFITAFPPALNIEAQAYFPGEALLALAAQYGLKPSGAILDAFDRAVLFYGDYFRETPSPAFVPWQVQAFSLMARHTKRKDYADFVFHLTDWLAAKQLTKANCPWPEMRGGIASYSPGRAGVSTSSYLEGFAAALVLARSVNDAARVERYEQVVRQAARFVMQLQVRKEEAYFMRNPKDAVGGVRASPSLNLLRIDHCQHALTALLSTRQVLYPDEG